MSEPLATTQPTQPRLNPWVFIPVLYFLQAIPVAIVQDVSTVIFKDLGVANEPITRWTSLIALPWAMQMLFGPLVDLNFTKRSWILNGQAIITVGLIGTALVLKTPNAFSVALVILGLSAVMSALTNIATDGFSLLAMNRTQQAQMAGFMSTFYRLGRLFCAALLVFVAGLMMRLPELPVAWWPDKSAPVIQSKVVVRDGVLADKERGPFEPAITVPAGAFQLEVDGKGDVIATTLKERTVIGNLPTDGTESPPVKGTDPASAWTLVLFIGYGVYLLGHIYCRFRVPRPAADIEHRSDTAETARHALRTVNMLGLGLSGYFLLNAVVRLSAHGLWALTGSDPNGPQKGWMLPQDNLVIGQQLPFNAVSVELAQLCVCGFIFLGGLYAWKRLISGTEVSKTLGSFIAQPGFGAIFFFILFYRFGEALVSKITPLFLKDAIDKGGLAITNEQLGILNGLLGVGGIILGGIIGGLTVSKLGLRKSFLPLALAMHVPNLLYLALSYRWLPMPSVEVPWIGPLNIVVGGTLFLDQFGYGFGFAGYMIYLMWVAQRGKYVTSHYAIGTGMGALCIAVAGVLSGVLQANFGYTGVFIGVIFMSIPGLLSLLFVPLDDSHKLIKAEVAD
ncbi:MAG: hypothetical protein KF784_14580 [Fimbriimonadaceae bacterium]|nr:hypothetical protein [Fimbriimonadaceae bacterium]